jgi:hypothetical protein
MSLTPFDCPGIDGPVGVTGEGKLYLSATNSERQIAHGLIPPYVVPAVSRRGDRFVLGGKQRDSDRFTDRLVNVLTGEVQPVLPDLQLAVEHVHEFVYLYPLRTRFTAITDDPTHGLVLTSRGGQTLRLIVSEDLALEAVRDVAVSGTARPFLPVPREGKAGYRLRCTEWPDGSRAFLDSRGLLHLQSSDRSVPEVSLVLRDGPLAGWCSDGTLFGPHYFTGVKNGPAAIRHVWITAIEPFLRRLP